MKEGELFGEISFLVSRDVVTSTEAEQEGIQTTASVVSNEDGTDVYIMEGAALTVLFARQPSLAGRFYQYLAQLLSTRLREREKAMEHSPPTLQERKFTMSVIK